MPGKTKCNGDGVKRCRASMQLPKAIHAKTAKATAPSSGGRDCSDGSNGLVSGHRFPGKLPLKRVRLSPSPATGLIGSRENVYVADFFRKIGFVPFTTKSFIRKAMLSIMFRTVQERDPEHHECLAGSLESSFLQLEDEDEDEDEEGNGEEQEDHCGDHAVVPTAGPWDAIESAAGACALWCTVAVGCLVGGRPVSSVDEYARLARKALSGCFDDISVHTARAFTAMALLEDFRGNEEKFNKYVDYAGSIMKALPATEVPMDLADAHVFVKAGDIFDGFYDQLDEEDLRDALGAASGLAKQTKPLQPAELCRWLLKTAIRLSACFSMDMQNAGFFGDQGKAEPQPAFSGPWPEPGSETSSGSDGDGSGDLLSSPPPGGYGEVSRALAWPNTPLPRVCWRRPFSCTWEGPPPPGRISETFAASVLPDMRLMTDVMERSDVHDGVGGLCFHGIMAYACSLQGQRADAVVAMLRCTDILVKNPGISRSTSWKHLVHICLNCMAVSGNEVKYEELRTSYNSVVDNDVPRAPPFAEFRGMSSICRNVFCNSAGAVSRAATATKSSAVPSSAAGRDGKRGLDHAENGKAPMQQRSQWMHSVQAGGTAPDTTEDDVVATSNNKIEEGEGLELLCASELEAAETAGLLDSVDALLGEVVCEGLGLASSDDDVTNAFFGEVLSEGFGQTSIKEDNAHD